jgi:uncharacterized protein
MFKAVLDTTVLVAAMLRPEPGGVSAELLRHAAEGKYELFLSDDILEETAATLMKSERTKRRYKYSDEHIVEYCEALAHIGTVLSDIPSLTGIVRDPNDDMIVACAVAAQADFLVSRDKDLLTLGSYGTIDMVTPEAFLRLLREAGLSSRARERFLGNVTRREIVLIVATTEQQNQHSMEIVFAGDE